MKARMRPRKWRESFTVWIDFIGDRSQVGPLLDHIAMWISDGGGSMVVPPFLSDQSWTVYPGKGDQTRITAEAIYNRIAGACARSRFSPYIRLRLLHDDRPDRCSPVEVISETTRAGRKIIRLKHAKNSRGPLVLRKYQRGKLPPIKAIKRKPRRKAEA